MRPENYLATRRASVLATNQVLRNTYFLLSLTLLFSAAAAAFAVVKNVGYVNPLLSFVGVFGLYFLTFSLRNSPMGLVAIFAFTGFLGYTLGPVLNMVMHGLSNGPQVVATSLGATGFIFLGLSGYVLTTKKDFSFLGGFLFVGMIVAIIASLCTLFLNVPMLSVVASSIFVLIASGMILFDTSRIIQNGEQNYIMATIQLYLDLYILFVNLLQILSVFGGRRN